MAVSRELSPGVAWITALVLLASACRDGGAPRGVERLDRAGVTIVSSWSPDLIAPEAWRVGERITSVGTVDGPPESQLYRVRGIVRLPDGRLVVANDGSSELRVYDQEGRWLRSMGREGDGPGEFRRIRRIQLVQPDTVVVFDLRGPRVTLFTADGELVASHRMASPVNPFLPPDYRAPDGRWLAVALSEEVDGYQRRRNTFVVWSESGPQVDSVLSGDGQEYLIYRRFRDGTYVGRGAVLVPFGGQDLVAAADGRVALSDGRAFDIAMTEIGGREFRFRRPGERRVAAGSDVEQFIDEYVARYPNDRQREVRDQFRTLEPAEYLPTHSALAFDQVGNLWVELYRLPWDAASPRMWSVFKPDGSWICDIAVPEGLEVYDIGGGHIAGVERDDLGVEYVRVYRILKGD